MRRAMSMGDEGKEPPATTGVISGSGGRWGQPLLLKIAAAGGYFRSTRDLVSVYPASELRRQK